MRMIGFGTKNAIMINMIIVGLWHGITLMNLLPFIIFAYINHLSKDLYKLGNHNNKFVDILVF